MDLKRDGIRLDVTILNAGVTPAKARKTASGQDEMFLVNYLANVMLTNLLMTIRGYQYQCQYQ
ncbi:MAG: hypothetical protein MZV63_36580 [Marinilabiliales bacterium]|nr:hypothetical protein [Marinilabiliales bacterium]